jgi:hypothetical protein
METKLPGTAIHEIFSGPVLPSKIANWRGFAEDVSDKADRFVCTSDCLAERVGFESSL